MTILDYTRFGACFTKHLKPKIFLSYIRTKLYGTNENLRLKMFSEMDTRIVALRKFGSNMMVAKNWSGACRKKKQ